MSVADLKCGVLVVLVPAVSHTGGHGGVEAVIQQLVAARHGHWGLEAALLEHLRA